MIEIGSGAGAALALGFLLGLRHATDADHVVAVATIVGERRSSLWRGVWIGASWGLGHTTPLLAVGVVILLLKEQFLQTYEGIAPYFEFAVGIMLVALGVQVLWNLAMRRLHLHEHLDSDSPHVHIHASHTHAPGVTPGGTHIPGHGAGGHGHGLWSSTRPVFRPKSYAIGVVHGLAGSAAVMLVLLPKIDSAAAGVGYLLLFGVGTILSMAIITLALGGSLRAVASVAVAQRAVIGLAGVASVVLGGALMAEITSGTSVIPF